jgi:hypothetical protein
MDHKPLTQEEIEEIITRLDRGVEAGLKEMQKLRDFAEILKKDKSIKDTLENVASKDRDIVKKKLIKQAKDILTLLEPLACYFKYIEYNFMNNSEVRIKVLRYAEDIENTIDKHNENCDNCSREDCHA